MQDTLELTKNDIGTWEIKLPESTESAKLEQAGFLAGIAGTEIMGIPIGGAAIGVGISSVIDALVTRFAPGQTGFLSGTMGKLLLAYATKQWGARWLGTKTADVAAFVFTIDAIGGWVEKLLGGLLGGAGLGQAKLAQAKLAQGVGLRQAEKVARDYYANAFGRR